MRKYLTLIKDSFTIRDNVDRYEKIYKLQILDRKNLLKDLTISIIKNFFFEISIMKMKKRVYLFNILPKWAYS